MVIVTHRAAALKVADKLLLLRDGMVARFGDSAEILKPDQALAGRFVSAVVPADQLLEEAYKIARRIAQHSPVAIALTRQMMYRCSAQPHPIEAHKVDSLAIYYTSLDSGKEGVKSFLEKRAPVFEERTSTDMPEFYPWWD